MSSCGVPVIDSRHQRVDFALTLGQGWSATVCAADAAGVPIDLTGRVFHAGLMTADGTEVFDLLPVVATDCITFGLNGLATEEAPLGLGVWSWFLREIVPVDEPIYWVGGSWTIHRVNSYSANKCTSGSATVCVTPDIVLEVS